MTIGCLIYSIHFLTSLISISITMNILESSSIESTSTTIKINNSKLSQSILDRFNEEELKMRKGILNLLSM